MFAQEPPPDFDVPGRRERGERPELVAATAPQHLEGIVRLARVAVNTRNSLYLWQSL